MGIPIFSVIKPGLFTTFQDEGRKSYQALGIPVSGAMDSFAHKAANILVGNRRNAAVLEVTISGPELQVENDAVISICGANLSPKINGLKAPLWTSFPVKRGDILSFGKNVSGARSYISVAGEFEIPCMLGSQSTDTKSKFGRPLKKGDAIYRVALQSSFKNRQRIRPNDLLHYRDKVQLRVLLGPHLDCFSNDTISTFLKNEFIVSPHSDRMGYRLEGMEVPHAKEPGILSEAVSFGSIQVPESGKPIILMADRQTTGGYPILATVISVDLPLLAQAVPGTIIHFKETTVEEAQAAYRKRETWFRILEKLK
ncbi:KipI antagonist [Pueribacillus theae]|uniref:KipI antagonist n=1 Tax=Pueribacillus theae TaxID=2171751 RepID=A0A2U1K629_9BACI|nr:biotin-dependent carboxyltransferase family protein [Pueribacillus theae]PWA12842.1 KipI antagonist [Pueribacillus theae]